MVPVQNEKSLIEILMSGSYLENFLVILLFAILLAATFNYCFKIFILNFLKKEENNFIHIIEDNLHDGRLDSALDFCKNLNSTQSRIANEALLRLDATETAKRSAIKIQIEKELSGIRNGGFIFSFLMQAAILVGIFATLISVFNIFWNQEGNQNFANSIAPLMLGIFIGIVCSALKYLYQRKNVATQDQIKESAYDFLFMLTNTVKNEK